MRLCLIFVAALSACTSFPELDEAQSPHVAEADFPDLLPIEDMLNGPETRLADGDADAILARAGAIRDRGAPSGAEPVEADAARVARLRARAADLRRIK